MARHMKDLEAAGQPLRIGGDELKILGRFLRPYRPLALGSAGLLITSTGLKLLGPVFLKRAIDEGIKLNDSERLNVFGALFVGSVILAFLALRWAAFSMGKVGQSTIRDMRVATFKHLASLSLGYFEEERSGRIVGRITSDSEAVEKLASEDLIRLLSESLFLVGAAILLFILDFTLALAALSVVPLMVLGTILFRRRAASAYRHLREKVASVLSTFQETLRGVQVVQAFSREGINRRKFGVINEEWADARQGAFELEAGYFSAMEMLGGIGTAAVLVYGGFRTIRGDLSFGTFTAFTVYLSLFFDPVHHLSERFSSLQSAIAGLARIAHLLETPPDIEEHTEPVVLQDSRGRFDLDAVAFSYDQRTARALEDVDLEVKPGETVALVGPTGAGKSTLIKLLARFYDPSLGSLSLDQIDLRDLAFASLRTEVALVPQEGFLFTGTIRDNIRFGKPDATDDEIEQVCKTLDIDDFIRSLPQGYETQVRERGARLAAGEKQLIALARALIADPRVILLDEATSSLDSHTEARIDAALKKTLGSRTLVVIAHRLSTVQNADRILVVQGGKIVESGDHEQLVAAGGRYASLYHYWLGGDLEKSQGG